MTRPLATWLALSMSPLMAQVTTLRIGGSAWESPCGVRVDSQANVYVAGTTASNDFPVTVPITNAPSIKAPKLFVTKLSPAGDVIFSIVLGGSGSDRCRAMTMDLSGNVYLAGVTQSHDFPVSANAIRKQRDPEEFDSNSDAFLLKLSSAGALIYSTLVGGRRDDVIAAVAVDDEGAIYIAGNTESGNFPVTADAYQKAPPAGDSRAFVAKLDPASFGIIWSTFLGNTTANLIAVGPDHSPVIGGATWDRNYPQLRPLETRPSWSGKGYANGFFTKLNASGSELVFSSILSGAGSVRAIAVDAANAVYLTGATASYKLPSEAPQTLPSPVLMRVEGSGEILAPPGGLRLSSVMAVAPAPSDPRIIYAGGPEGLFRSQDAGETWQATKLGEVAIGVLAVHPWDADTLYAASSISDDVAGGVWKSTDGGQTFQRLDVGVDALDALLIDPSRPDRIFARRGVVYRSTDGGGSWSKIDPGVVFALSGLTVDPESPDTLLAGTAPQFAGRSFGPGYLTRSTDGGESFQLAQTGYDYSDLTFAHGLLFSHSQVSEDHGKTWKSRSAPGRFAAFDGASLYVITGENELKKSGDDGATWKTVAGPPEITVQSAAISGNRLFIGARAASDAFLVRLNAEGGLEFTRFFGGAKADGGASLMPLQDGRILLTGLTVSEDFPVLNSVSAFEPLLYPWTTLNLFTAEFDGSGAMTFSTPAGTEQGWVLEGTLSAYLPLTVQHAGIIWTVLRTEADHVGLVRINRR